MTHLDSAAFRAAAARALEAVLVAGQAGRLTEIPGVGWSVTDAREAAAAAAPHYAAGRRGADAGDAAADVLTPWWRTLPCRMARIEAWRDASEFLDWVEEHAPQLATVGERT